MNLLKEINRPHITSLKDAGIGFLYAIFHVDYEPHMIVRLNNMEDLETVKKEYAQYGEYIGTYKCVKK